MYQHSCNFYAIKLYCSEGKKKFFFKLSQICRKHDKEKKISPYILIMFLESRERSSPRSSSLEPRLESISGSSNESSSSIGDKPESSSQQSGSSSSSGQETKSGGHSISPKFSIFPAHYAHIRNKNKGYVP